MTEQQAAFWDTIDVFNKEGLLPYVMLIGSWAEYIYQLYFKTDFFINLKTRDVDFLYPNLNKPKEHNIEIIKSMESKGFIYTEDYVTGVGKFVKEDLLELEFITRALGRGQTINEIPSLNIKAEGMREVNMLADYPLELDCNGFMIVVPEPEAYMLHKLLINSIRKPDYKKEKDIQSLRELLKHLNREKIQQIFDCMPPKAQKKVVETKDKHFIEF